MTNAGTAQSYANHARFVPLYHFFALSVLALNLLWALWGLLSDFGLGSIMNLLLAAALVLIGLYARLFALAVQDRLIRLEMRWRLAEILPNDLHRRFDELSKNQLVALRFASDAEVPDLVISVLEEDEQDRSKIKRRIKQWLPDDWRV